MIWESCYWKDTLLAAALRLRKRKSQKRWPETSAARVEQDVMVAAYSIRKLIEADKIATATATMVVDIQQFASRGKPVTRMNWHKLEELYDLSSPRTCRMGLLAVCNQIIHSYVFTLLFSDTGRLEGLLFTSDRKRNDRVHSLSLDQLIQVLERVGTDYPNSMHMSWNKDTQDYDVESSCVRVDSLSIGRISRGRLDAQGG